MSAEFKQLVLRDIKFKGYHLRFKEDFILKYGIYDEGENGSGYYYIEPNKYWDFGTMLDGHYNSLDSFIKDLNEEIVVSWKLYVKDGPDNLTEDAKRFGEMISRLIEPIETIEDIYSCDEFFRNVIKHPAANLYMGYLTNIGAVVKKYGFDLKCVRIEENDENGK